MKDGRMFIQALKLTPFSPEELRPTGWLRKQLELQADGLAGHLHEVWPDIRDSRWIGGDREGWERVPYWLDGLIPLAWLLQDTRLKQVATRYVDAILQNQEEDGWICPCRSEERAHYDMWALFLICKVLVVYYDCTKDPRIPDAVYRAMKQFEEHNRQYTLFNWGHARWFEALIPLAFLAEHRPQPWQRELALRLYYQGMDFETDLKERYEADPQNWSYYTHVVNVAMSLKAEAELSRFTGKPLNGFAQQALRSLEKQHGMACGHFSGDECLDGNSSIAGTELCGVVEAMYSYERLLQITGDSHWGDRLEQIAYNALPAAIAPDMWSHQYDQMTNQIQCAPIPEGKQPFRTNNGEAHLFGLEPHYGCCTSNFGQGWPKLAWSAFARAADGIVSAVLAPMELETVYNGVRVWCALETAYPFEDGLQYRIRTERPVEMTLYIRIPGCMQAATVDGVPVKPGAFYPVHRMFEGESTIVVQLTPEIRFVSRPGEQYCVERGALLYSLPIAARREKWEYTKDGVERRFPYCDWKLFPMEDWAFAFVDKEATLVKRRADGPVWSPTGAPCGLQVKLAPIPWHEENGVCAPTCDSRRPCGPVTEKELIPYGCTELRMTEMPMAEV